MSVKMSAWRLFSKAKYQLMIETAPAFASIDAGDWVSSRL